MVWLTCKAFYKIRRYQGIVLKILKNENIGSELDQLPLKLAKFVFLYRGRFR